MKIMEKNDGNNAKQVARWAVCEAANAQHEKFN